MGARCSCSRRCGPGAAGAEAVQREAEPSEDSSSESEISAQSTAEQTVLAAPFQLIVGADRGLVLDLVTPPADTDWETSELRLYIVWQIPGCNPPQLYAGLHWGFDRCGYQGILELNGRHFGGIKWHRVYSIARGRELFFQEAPRHRVLLDEVVFYRWQLN